MKHTVNIPDQLKFRAAYLFFVLYTIMVGVGFVPYPRDVYEVAGQDSWLIVILAGILVHLVMMIIIFCLKSYGNTDLHGILQQTFGRWIGKLIGYLFIIYFFLVYVTILMKYTEFIRTFIFPSIAEWVVAALCSFLVVYCIYGGIRAIIGTSFIFYLLTFWLNFLFFEPATLMDFNNFQPMLDIDSKGVIQGIQITAYTLLGIEVIWMLYPYVHNQKRTMLYSQLGILGVILSLLSGVVISIGYFAPNQLIEQIWPILTIYKIISFPFFERFDIFVVSFWKFIILPNLIFYAWLITRSLKRVNNIKQKHSIWVVVVLSSTFIMFFKSREAINQFVEISAEIGIYFVYVFPFLILPFAIYRRIRGANK